MSKKYSVPGFFEVAWKFFAEGKRGQIFNLTLEQLGVEYEPLMIQKLLQIYREHKPTISLHLVVPAVVLLGVPKTLQRNGYLAIATLHIFFVALSFTRLATDLP